MSHHRSACCHEVLAATRDDQSRTKRAILVSVFGSSLEVVLVGGFLILARSLLSKDWNSLLCLVPFICLHQRGQHKQVGDPDYVHCAVTSSKAGWEPDYFWSCRDALATSGIWPERRTQLYCGEKRVFTPLVKLLRTCTLIISNYTVIIMCHLLLQIIPINSLNRTHEQHMNIEQPFDSVLVLCSALWTWTREIGLLMMLYK